MQVAVGMPCRCAASRRAFAAASAGVRAVAVTGIVDPRSATPAAPRGSNDWAVPHQAPAHALGAEVLPVMGGQDLPAEFPPQG